MLGTKSRRETENRDCLGWTRCLFEKGRDVWDTIEGKNIPIKHTIQLGYELDTHEHYCSKMTDINDELQFSDPLNAYSAEDSNIVGFTLYLS